MNIIPVILCGGSGDRLWPLSRKSYPKQFLDLIGDESLFQQAAKRVETGHKPIILTGDDYRFIVRQQLHEIGIKDADVIIEPSGKNTAPAILAAACHVAAEDRDALMMVMPSDHYIPDHKAFAEMVQRACHDIKPGQILCFGITPNRPETGYGYIKTESIKDGVMPVDVFTEKPDAETAQSFLDDGRYLWNAGIFMMRAQDILDMAASLQADMLATTLSAYEDAVTDLDFLRLDVTAWDNIVAESFDYAFMEKAQDIGCMAFMGAWSDLGDWNALAHEKEADAAGNILHGDAHQSDCENTLLWAEQDDQALVGHGLNNIIAVAMRDAVLVADRTNPQAIKNVVAALRDDHVPQASTNERDHRPWGWFNVIAKGDQFKVKVINVDPGQALSLQSHEHRSEHWVVVKGIATVVQDDQEFTLKPNESIYNHIGIKHQLKNNTAETVQIVEVQTGSYLGEDDIVRYHDIYNRDE